MRKLFKEVTNMGRSLEELSKFISLILRHKPNAANIELDEHGWANVDDWMYSRCDCGSRINIRS